MKDLQWKEGSYYSSSQPSYGLSVARMLSHISYMSQASLWEKFGRKLQNKKSLEYGFGNEFEVESYLSHQGESFTQRFDANSYLYITHAIDYFDISRGKKNAYFAFENTSAKCLVVSISSDWLYPPLESIEIVDALRYNNIDTSYFEFNSDKGHDAFLIPNKDFENLISGFLKENKTKKKSVTPLKFHHKLVYDQISENSRVLDLGCGEGEVLYSLINEKNCSGFGIDIDSNMVAKCIEKGVSVVQSNMEGSLTKYKNDSFDFVVLDETLQTVKNSVEVLNQAGRVGKKIIVTFPNFAHVDVRSYLVLKGRMPMSKELPYAWYNTPNIHLFTIKDFEELCRQNGFNILKKVYYNKSKKKLLNIKKPNLLAKNALFVIEKK